MEYKVNIEELSKENEETEEKKDRLKELIGFAFMSNNLPNGNGGVLGDIGYQRMTVPELLASPNKRLRQIGHILQHYGKY